jgi:hypothetical protein
MEESREDGWAHVAGVYLSCSLMVVAAATGSLVRFPAVVLAAFLVWIPTAGLLIAVGVTRGKA